jgi:nicotinamidase-related amidase
MRRRSPPVARAERQPRRSAEHVPGSSAFAAMSQPFVFQAADVLVVIDVINDFQHEDGERLLASFNDRLPAMTEAIARARTDGVPVIYVNDERGRWDSDAPALIRAALEGKHSAEIVKSLAPRAGDHVLLKHRYSAFDHTPLELLLDQLHVDRLVLIGAATEGCIVQTAIDARERDLKTTIIADACATTNAELESVALHYADQVVGARIAHVQLVR